MKRFGQVLLFTAAFGIGAATAAHAAVRYVENYGVDGGACGTLSAPCRSIRQGIVNASAGDVLLVGPGYYGDIDNDGLFTSPGDEAAEVGTGCNCMIKVDKRLTIISRRGLASNLVATQATGTGVALFKILAKGTVLEGFALLVPEPNSIGVGIDTSADLSIATIGVYFTGTNNLMTGSSAE
ncbi:MAG TPA: hypothetical protein VL403_01885, partial [Candidatus Kryptonia bacterium]|nr:hypothetical protein [Candidatus Kryptonia bacterium]